MKDSKKKRQSWLHIQITCTPPLVSHHLHLVIHRFSSCNSQVYSHEYQKATEIPEPHMNKNPSSPQSLARDSAKWMGLFPLKSGTELILPNYGIHTPAEASEDFYLLEHKKRKPESCLESTTSCHSELHLKASLMAIEIGITRWQSTKETGE